MAVTLGGQQHGAADGQQERGILRGSYEPRQSLAQQSGTPSLKTAKGLSYSGSVRPA